MAYIRPARSEDAELLAPILRRADLAEINAAVGLPPAAALRIAIKESLAAYTMSDPSGPVAIFGVAPGIVPWAGSVWLLATDRLVTDHRRTFLRLGEVWTQRLHQIRPVLHGWVDSRNELHRRWLSWMGFLFTGGTIRQHDPDVPFVEFIKIGSTSICASH